MKNLVDLVDLADLADMCPAMIINNLKSIFRWHCIFLKLSKCAVFSGYKKTIGKNRWLFETISFYPP